MSMTPRPFPPLLPVHNSGCTVVCVDAPVRLATELGLLFCRALHLPWRCFSGISLSHVPQTGERTGSFPPSLLCAQRWR